MGRSADATVFYGIDLGNAHEATEKDFDDETLTAWEALLCWEHESAGDVEAVTDIALGTHNVGKSYSEREAVRGGQLIVLLRYGFEDEGCTECGYALAVRRSVQRAWEWDCKRIEGAHQNGSWAEVDDAVVMQEIRAFAAKLGIPSAEIDRLAGQDGDLGWHVFAEYG